MHFFFSCFPNVVVVVQRRSNWEMRQKENNLYIYRERSIHEWEHCDKIKSINEWMEMASILHFWTFFYLLLWVRQTHHWNFLVVVARAAFMRVFLQNSSVWKSHILDLHWWWVHCGVFVCLCLYTHCIEQNDEMCSVRWPSTIISPVQPLFYVHARSRKKKWKTRHDKSNQPIHTRANDFWYVCTRTIFFSRALLYKKRK